MGGGRGEFVAPCSDNGGRPDLSRGEVRTEERIRARNGERRRRTLQIVPNRECCACGPTCPG